VSPLLNQIYLDRLDQCVGTVLLRAGNRGDRRRPYPQYMSLLKATRHKQRAGALTEVKCLLKPAQQRPSRGQNDQAFRRLWYVSYADDWLLGSADHGTKPR
jgi:hypothetical protein